MSLKDMTRFLRPARTIAVLALVLSFAVAGCSLTSEDSQQAPAASVFGLESGTVLSVVPDICPDLPAGPVDATYVHPGTTSFFNTTLTGVAPGFGIEDGVYAGWCVEDNFQENTPDPAVPYCSLDTELPGNLNDYPWDKVNYLLNNKAGTPEEVEAAIWVLVWGNSFTFPVTPAVTAMVDDANANGMGYMPGAGDIIAVILYTGDGGIGPDGFQETIIEVLVPRTPQTGSIGDQVWCDENENGLMDNGETGISGVTVDLVCAGPDGTFDTGDDIVDSQVTDSDGMYLFTGLPAGMCKVTVDTSTVPTDCNNGGQCATNYDVDLGEGQDYLDADFCFTPPTPPPPGDEGCTPGYWKNHVGAWDTTAYGTQMLVGTVFVESSAYPDLFSATLRQGLRFRGGSDLEGAAEIMLRAAIAALLNASSGNVEYPRTVADIIADVDAALLSGDRQTMIDLGGALDDDNNLGCPLGRNGVRNQSASVD